MTDELKKLQKRILSGDRLAVSRAMSVVENKKTGFTELLDSLHPHLGKAHRIGITGPPGAGKSTFTNQLAKIYRSRDQKIGVVAIDPTSPFTGGAILGDRVRMMDLALDKNIFIRSMATRGSLGGLAKQATEVADILDAAGYDIIIYETVGVGQVELDIVEAADSTIVMIVPEGGDIIQGMKAGLMEIGDVFVLNKSDRPGAERLKTDLEYVLHLKEPGDGWYAQVLLTVANKGTGIAEVLEQIDSHKHFLESSGKLVNRRNKRLKNRVEFLVNEALSSIFWNMERKQIVEKYLKNDKNNLSPYRLAEKLLRELGAGE